MDLWCRDVFCGVIMYKIACVFGQRRKFISIEQRLICFKILFNEAEYNEVTNKGTK
jgi:hypothetical protein